MEQMIGNAVPVKLAEFVARALIEYIQNNKNNETAPGFYSWLIDSKGYSERAAKDVLSRFKRAERILPACGDPDSFYISRLEKQDEFKGLSVNVRSQIKKAVSLRVEYGKTLRGN